MIKRSAVNNDYSTEPASAHKSAKPTPAMFLWLVT